MAKYKVVTTDAEIERAIEKPAALREEARVMAVEYRPGLGLDLLILKMNDGHRVLVPREDLEGLQAATKEQIREVEILGNGTGLHWPALDLDYYVPHLLRGIYGTKRWMVQIGRSAVQSRAKRRSGRREQMDLKVEGRGGKSWRCREMTPHLRDEMWGTLCPVVLKSKLSRTVSEQDAGSLLTP